MEVLEQLKNKHLLELSGANLKTFKEATAFLPSESGQLNKNSQKDICSPAKQMPCTSPLGAHNSVISQTEIAETQPLPHSCLPKLTVYLTGKAYILFRSADARIAEKYCFGFQSSQYRRTQKFRVKVESQSTIPTHKSSSLI